MITKVLLVHVHDCLMEIIIGGVECAQAIDNICSLCLSVNFSLLRSHLEALFMDLLLVGRRHLGDCG